MVRSTWLAASTGTLVSCETRMGSSLAPSRLAYSWARVQAGPDHFSPVPLVFSTSHGAFASTATRKAPDFLMASIRGLLPGAGTSCAQAGAAAAIAPTTAQATMNWPNLLIFASSLGCSTAACSRRLSVMPLPQSRAHAVRRKTIQRDQHRVAEIRRAGQRGRHYVGHGENRIDERAMVAGRARCHRQPTGQWILDVEPLASLGAALQKAEPGRDAERDPPRASSGRQAIERGREQPLRQLLRAVHGNLRRQVP